MNFYLVGKEEALPKMKQFFKGDAVENIIDADIIVFPDENRELNEGFYGRLPVYGDRTKLMSDAYLMRVFMAAVIEYGIPVIGFGSGAHLVSMASGAEMFGGANHHLNPHPVITHSGEFISIGEHIQIMNPSNMAKDEYSILGYSATSRAQRYHIGRDIKVTTKLIEPEIVFYKFVNVLAIQSPIYEMGNVLYKTFGQSLANILIDNPKEIVKFAPKIPKL